MIFQHKIIQKENNNKVLVQIHDLTTNKKYFEFVTESEVDNINSYRQKEAHVVRFFSKSSAFNFCKNHNFNDVKII